MLGLGDKFVLFVMESLLCNQERCIIKTIFVAGGRTGVAISYKKLRKLFVDKKESKADLRMRKVFMSCHKPLSLGLWCS